MSDEYVNTRAIGDLLGYTNPASTRKWILRYELEAKRRDTDTGEKEYLRSEVEAAIARMPGQGARTDLASDEEPPHDHDRIPDR
jgi:hypothetical protein